MNSPRSRSLENLSDTCTARGAGDGVKPRVERNGTRGTQCIVSGKARETGDGPLLQETPPPLRGSLIPSSISPGSAALHPGLYSSARFAGCNAYLAPQRMLAENPLEQIRHE